MSKMVILVWLTKDLRLADHPALAAAADTGAAVVPFYIWSPEEEREWAPGAASRWWLHRSLQSLDMELASYGSRLVLRSGPVAQAVEALVAETGAKAVYWIRQHEPDSVTIQASIETLLKSKGVHCQAFQGRLLTDPAVIRNQQGKPFQVFTPYWRTALPQVGSDKPVPRPQKLATPGRWPKSVPLESFQLSPRIPWDVGMQKAWRPGSAGAQAELKRFLDRCILNYDAERNIPGVTGTSRLSPYLHFGEISPLQVWNAVANYAGKINPSSTAWRNWQFMTELGWREFAYYLLKWFPETTGRPLRRNFENFPWRENSDWLEAWQKGQTGIPMVDAGMRELWTTGWMHNRVRMIVASFLVKNLLQPWQSGARWFWDTLVDADLASNTLGWQWCAGCGADAAPFFRIFNPVSQGEKFDPQGRYVRQWVPELARMPDEWIHQPWMAPKEILSKAGVELNQTYPKPIVSLTISREVALEAYRKITRPTK